MPRRDHKAPVENLFDYHDDGDPLHVRQQAGRQGWGVDSDGWIWRESRAKDARCFFDGFAIDGRVYMPDCVNALKYDAACGAWARRSLGSVMIGVALNAIWSVLHKKRRESTMTTRPDTLDVLITAISHLTYGCDTHHLGIALIEMIATKTGYRNHGSHSRIDPSLKWLNRGCMHSPAEIAIARAKRCVETAGTKPLQIGNGVEIAGPHQALNAAMRSLEMAQHFVADHYERVPAHLRTNLSSTPMEREQAIKIANDILDDPGLDPDADFAIVSRQFLRAIEPALVVEPPKDWTPGNTTVHVVSAAAMTPAEKEGMDALTEIVRSKVCGPHAECDGSGTQGGGCVCRDVARSLMEKLSPTVPQVIDRAFVEGRLVMDSKQEVVDELLRFKASTRKAVADFDRALADVLDGDDLGPPLAEKADIERGLLREGLHEAADDFAWIANFCAKRKMMLERRITKGKGSGSTNAAVSGGEYPAKQGEAASDKG